MPSQLLQPSAFPQAAEAFRQAEEQALQETLFLPEVLRAP